MALKTAEGTYVYEVPEGLVIPQGATHLWVYNNDNAEKCAAISIPAHDVMPSVSNPLYTFSVLSDIHVAADKTIQCENLSSALSYIKNNTQSSAVITVGDNVDNGTESAWSAFNTIRNQYISSSLPMYCAIGNHEWKDANGTSSSTAALDSEYTARFKNNAVAALPEQRLRSCLLFFSDERLQIHSARLRRPGLSAFRNGAGTRISLADADQLVPE